VRGIFEFPLQHFENTLDIAEDIVIPNSNCPVSKLAHCRIALRVSRIVRMLATIDLHHEMPFAAYEVRKIGSDRLLTHEFAARQLPIAKTPPEQKFGPRTALPQRAGSSCLDRVRPPHAPHPDPLPASGEREIVAPVNKTRSQYET
jgi:hypothetical protein